VGHEPRAILDPFQILVQRVVISLAVQNLLETKAGVSSIVFTAGISTFEGHAFSASKANRKMAAELLEDFYGGKQMAKHSVSVSRLIHAPARTVYDLIADYRNGHPRILPKPYFRYIHVEQGGYGAGTIVNFQMQLLGRVQSFRSRITEPEAGHILAETDMNTGAVTTFRVEPQSDGQETLVTITTTTEVSNGIVGKIQGWLTTKLLRPVYEKELEQVEAIAIAEAQ
jgi:hypothetical protein